MEETAATLESAEQQWESQAPFVFESLQVLDESRISHLRDLLTQYQTHESDQAQRTMNTTGEVLAQVLEIQIEKEIQDFASKTAASGGKIAERPVTRKGSNAAASLSTENRTGDEPATSEPYPLPRSDTGPSTRSRDDSFTEKGAITPDAKPRGLRRLGTMFGGRKRQSTFGPLGQASSTPQKGPPSSSRLNSSHGRGISPKPSSSNLYEASRMTSVAESNGPVPSEDVIQTAPSGSDLNGAGVNLMDTPVPSGANGTDMSAAAAPSTQPVKEPTSPVKDSEGFSIPSTTHDPISEAQREAAGEDADQLFKLNIQKRPVDEEDPEEKQAALSSVANSLKMGPATRRTGTIRGRRDVRNTIYVPSPTSTEIPTDRSLPAIPGSPEAASSPPGAMAALTSEPSITGTSDTQSVRSGHSLGTLGHIKHPDLTGPGLQSSIIETVSAAFEDGVIKTATVVGEVAFANSEADSDMKCKFEPRRNRVGEDDSDVSVAHETIRINNFPSLEKIGPNRIFVQNTSADHPDQFTLDNSHLAKTAIAFSYRVFADAEDAAALNKDVPLLIKPAWKLQGDKLGLLLQYQLNPDSKFTSPTVLQNVAFVVTYDGNASGAQTKPSGTHLREKKLVYWRLGDVTLTNEMQRIVCRIIGAEGNSPQPGHVEARWDYAVPEGEEALGSGISISKLEESKGKAKEEDPFTDEGSDAGEKWTVIPAQRKLIAGKYEAR